MGIGMVFQHFSLFETLTVAENITLALDTPIPAAELAQRITRYPTNTACPSTRTAWCTACRWASGSASKSCVACLTSRAADHG